MRLRMEAQLGDDAGALKGLPSCIALCCSAASRACFCCLYSRRSLLRLSLKPSSSSSLPPSSSASYTRSRRLLTMLRSYMVSST